MLDFSNWVPPLRRDRHWVVHIARPTARPSPRMTDEVCMAHATACRWPAGWTPVEASDVMRRRRGRDSFWVRVVLQPVGDPVPGPGPDAETLPPSRGRVLAFLDPNRAGLVEDRVHLGGGWYSVGVDLVVGRRWPPGDRSAEGQPFVEELDGQLVQMHPRVPDQALAWDADLSKSPIQDYRTCGGSLLRVVQDLRVGATRWAGEDGWGPFVQVQVLELGRGDPDVPADRPTRPGCLWLLHAEGVAFASSVGEGCVEVTPGHWVRRFEDDGLSAWARAAAATREAAGTVVRAVFGPIVSAAERIGKGGEHP